MSTCRSAVFAIAIVLAAGTIGCVGVAEVDTTASARLVWVSPGVWVVEDYGSPIFYHDSYYWMWSGGVWHRSGYYTGGFAPVTVVPHVVLGIRRPSRYVRYRAPRGVRVQPIQRRRPSRSYHSRPRAPTRRPRR